MKIYRNQSITTIRGKNIIWCLLLIVLSSQAITVLSLLLGLGLYDIQIFFDYFRHPIVFLVNWFPVLLLELFVVGVSGRCWLSYLTTSFVVLLSSIGSFYKIRFRGEPFVFSDLRIIGTALGVANEFDLTPNTRIILSVMAIILGTIFFLLAVREILAKSFRFFLVLVTLVAVPISWTRVYSNEDYYYNRVVSEDHIEVKTLASIESISKGSVYPFLFSMHKQIETPPYGYSEEEARTILEGFQYVNIPEEQKAHILVFQLESFCDLTEIGLDNLEPETYELLHRLKENSVSGILVTNTIGGGTINAERTFLTGDYNLEEYKEPAYSNIWYLRDQGYKTIANHPYSSRYYSRSSVNHNLGFERFWSMDDLYKEVSELDNIWLSDYLLFPTVLDQLQSMRNKNEHVFSFTVTAQGHGGYSTEEYNGDVEYWHGVNCSQRVKNEVNNYLKIIVDTQRHIYSMLSQLEKEAEPVIVVLYGDHKPIFTGNFYDELRINMDCSTLEGFNNYYATRYLIWANNDAKQLFSKDFIGEGPAISPCYLMTYLFDLLGWDGSPVMQLNRQLMKCVPVINTNGYYVEDGVYCTELSENTQALLSKMDRIQYYLRHSYSRIS